MKNYIKITLLAVVTTYFVSCEDRLELEPEQSLTPEELLTSSENVLEVLTGTFTQASSFSSYGGNITTIAELLSNTGELQWRGTFTDFGDINARVINTSNSFVESFWLSSYRVSNQANIVLANLDLVEGAALKEAVEGQAKFLRAVAYFDLLRFFSKPYKNGMNAGEAGVPIVTNAVTELTDITYPTRNTIQEVYDFIIKDLKDAGDLLPAQISFDELPELDPAFATKYAAKGLLARVYLQQGNFEGARDLSNEVIESGLFQLNTSYYDTFTVFNNTPEDVFAWQNANAFVTYWATERFGGRSGNPDIALTDDFYLMFDDINDDRVYYTYQDPELGEALAAFKWYRSGSNVPFIRLAEMYLIRAESNFRLQTEIGTSPANDLNRIRTRSFTTALSIITLEDIINERIREFSFEGIKLHDFKRLELSLGVLNYDDDKLVLPIPQRERNANPNLSQNDGY